MEKRIELLAPAGNMEKLKVALHYGADAVYGGPADFSLRAGKKGVFQLDELEEAIEHTHTRSARFFLTLNSFLREDELDRFAEMVKTTASFNPDAFIISDPGAIAIAREIAPHIPIHLSTQGNNLNSRAINLWAGHGITRVILARELSLREITSIRQNTDIDIECFIHGAVCISYSGRCMLSKYLTGRDANKGDCSHPCRWSYTLVEEKRPGEYFQVEEDQHGTYFFNSKDLCSIDLIPQIIASGVSSMKIEGRMKTVNYVATVVSVYRNALDYYYENPENYKVMPEWRLELEKINTREYTTGFFLPEEEHRENPDKRPFTPRHRYAGLVKKTLPGNRCVVTIKNSISTGDLVEVVTKGSSINTETVKEMTDMDNQPIQRANPNQEVIIRLKPPAGEMSIIRKA